MDALMSFLSCSSLLLRLLRPLVAMVAGTQSPLARVAKGLLVSNTRFLVYISFCGHCLDTTLHMSLIVMEQLLLEIE